MLETVRHLNEAQERWHNRGWPRPDVILVSGSGLAIDLESDRIAEGDLTEIFPYPIRSVEGHPHGFQILAPSSGLTLLYLRGRVHGYQGYDEHQTVFLVRLGALLGASVLILTNAAGGLDPQVPAGTLSLITDQLNLSGRNPLSGVLPPEWGPQFPDMSHAYSPRLRDLAKEQAAAQSLDLAEGVYAGLAGPSYETPAEVRMLKTLGADLVGMSTVLEVIAARHLGMECLGISVVANAAAGLHDEPLEHGDVLTAVAEARTRLHDLVQGLIQSSGLVADSG